MKKLLLFSILFSFFVSRNLDASFTEIREESVRKSSALSAVKLLHKQGTFVVSDEDGQHEIENAWLDSTLQKLIKNEEALEKFLEIGTIEVKKDTAGEYLLRPHVRGLGGGPILALIFAGTTQAVCYGTAIAAATTMAAGVATATGGTAIAPMVTVAGATLTGAMGGGAASGTAAAILLAGGGQAAVGLTGAALASGSAAAGMAGATGAFAGVTATVGMINSLSSAAFALGMAIPFF